MTDSEHPESFEDFINGRLSSQENDTIIAHLITCDVCAAKVERLWVEIPDRVLTPSTAGPDAQDAVEAERSLFRRIHRSDLGGQLVRLGTEGLVSLLAGILRPIVSNFRGMKSSGG